MAVEYQAITQLSDRLNRARVHAPRIVDLWLHRMVGPALVTEMQMNAPVASGNLRDQIRAINEPGSVRVGPFGVEYNRFVVEGTKPHTITPKNGNRLVFKVGGRTVYAKRVNHPGTAPNDYMKVSTEAVMKRMLPRLTKLTIDVVKTGQVPSG